MPPAGGDDGLGSARHGGDQGVPALHRDSSPGFLDGLAQFPNILWSDVGSSYVTLQKIPKVFNGVEIRTFSRMSCNIDVILSKGIHCMSSCVRLCIVMHEKHVSMLLHEWSDMRQNDLIHITDRSNTFSWVAVIEIEEDMSKHDIMGHCNSYHAMHASPALSFFDEPLIMTAPVVP